MHIALVEDDPDQAAALMFWMAQEGHTTKHAPDLKSFTAMFAAERFQAVLVDWMLPDGSGAEAVGWVRQNLGWGLPVIIVTALEDEATVCSALQGGADDYLVKPLKRAELAARLAAVTRRVSPRELATLRVGVYEIDHARQCVSVNRKPIRLTQKEFDLADYIFQNPEKLLSRDHLLNKVWGINVDVDTRTVDTHVSRLRKKLGLDADNGWVLVPVYGFGYRLDRVPSFTKQSSALAPVEVPAC